MAIRPDVELAPNITAATASFPLGSSKNETAPGVNDGTPYNLTRADDIFGFQQALLKAANIVASGNTDTALDKNSSQYLQAVLHQVLSGFVFDESGVADAYVLDVVGNNPAPADYEANMTFQFVATNTNTGASTVDVASLGVKNIFFGGAALTGGEIIVGNTTTIIFDVANDRFNLIEFVLGQATGISLLLTGAAASPPDANTLVKDNICKGWIKLNGSGVIAINDSYNVSGIIDGGTGIYTITWDTNFANTDYCPVGLTQGSHIVGHEIADYAVGSLVARTFNTSDIAVDVTLLNIVVFGDQ